MNQKHCEKIKWNLQKQINLLKVCKQIFCHYASHMKSISSNSMCYSVHNNVHLSIYTFNARGSIYFSDLKHCKLYGYETIVKSVLLILDHGRI